MGTTKKKLSIDEAARKLRAEWAEYDAWCECDSKVKGKWHNIARLARKLFETPAAKPLPKKPKPLVCEACGKSKRSVCRRTDWMGLRFYSCERCWCHMAGDEFDQRVAAHRAKASTKRRRHV